MLSQILLIFCVILLLYTFNKEGFRPCYQKTKYEVEAIKHLYSPDKKYMTTAEVDPEIVGHLYDGRNFVRNVYAGRTALLNNGTEDDYSTQGLVEFSSSGSEGDVGVTVGPVNDGIPTNWELPESPVQWYGPLNEDHYGALGPTVYDKNLFALTEPDHDPLMN